MASDMINEVVEPTTASSIPPAVVPADSQGQSRSLVIAVAEQPKTRSKARVLAILIALYLSLFIVALDQTITAVAVPTISSDLHGASNFVWIGGAYLLAQAAAAPIWAKLSDIWGRKPVLLCVIAWFFGSSIVCATAKSMNALIIGRAFQGTGAGGLTLVIIIFSDIYSIRTRALFIGLREIIWVIAAGIGPLLGGAFVQLLSWRWAFWINLPVTGTAFVLLLLFLDVHNPRTKTLEGIKAIDWFGSLTVLGMTLMLLIGLNFGGVLFPWNSVKVICLIVFGSLMAVLFIFIERKQARYPLMPPAVFGHRSNISALLVTFFHGIAYLGPQYYVPVYFQAVLGVSPLRSGVLILPYLVPGATAGLVAGFIINRTGRYLDLIYIGAILLTVGESLFTIFGTNASLAKIIPIQTVAGIGAGLLIQPSLIALHAMVKQDHVAAATATNGFVRNIASSLSVVIGGLIFQNCMENRRESLNAANLPSDLVQAFSGHESQANVVLIDTVKDKAQSAIIKAAYAGSFRNVWIFYACTAACTFIAGLFIAKAVLSTEHVETKTGLHQGNDNGERATTRGEAIELQ